MAKDVTELKAEVNDNITANSNEEITGPILNGVLTSIIDSYLNLAELLQQNLDGPTSFLGILEVEGLRVYPPVGQIVINSFDDLPTPVANVITLLPGVKYLLGQNVSLGVNRIQMGGNTVFSSVDELVCQLSYSGSDTLFTGASSYRLEQFSVSAPNGEVFSIAGTGSERLVVERVDCAGCDRIGTVADIGGFGMERCAFVNSVTRGILFSGSHVFAKLSRNLLSSDGGIIVDIDAALFDNFDIFSTDFTLPSGVTGVSGLASSANINSGGFGRIGSCSFNGLGTPVAGITNEDAFWEFKTNQNVQDTRPDGLLSLTDNATETTIVTPGIAVLIGGTWNVEETSQFTGTIGGRLTYVGGRTVRLPIDAAVGLVSSSGVNKSVSLYIALNGAIIPNSKMTSVVSSSDKKNTPVPWQVNLDPGDYIEVFVANDTDTINLIATDATLRIN